MEQKAFTLLNRGMNRDSSISKVGESAAYENHNIRIIARDDDTLLSVTNERGTKATGIELANGEILLGWNILNNNIILFTNKNGDAAPDRIYLIEYSNSDYGFAPITLLFQGNLGFRDEDGVNGIESITYYETDDVQKIYWLDGKNVLRFMNFMAKTRTVNSNEYYPWQDDEGNYDNTYFDSNRAAKFDVSVAITKDNSGNPRANGVAQYLLTYFNKHGQETNYVWISDLVYLTPEGRGGTADGQNNNRVVLNISNLDTSYDHYRVYMVLRTTLDGQTVAYLVSEGSTDESVTVIDDGAHLTLQDANRLLYLGSQPVIAGTMTHKDQTLFLGDLKSIGRGDVYERLSTLTRAMYNHETGLTNEGVIEFVLTDSTDIASGIANIPYVEDEGLYPYKNQLSFTSGQIMSFKGGEKYRFALKFQLSDGKETDAFWIGDAENNVYPIVDDVSNTISRPIAKCKLSAAMVSELKALGIKTVQMMIAEATYADRSVKAQGFVNPTVFNVWERYNNRTYGVPSWILRPKNSEIEYSHFKPIHNSISDTAEIECNYWALGVDDPTPYYEYDTVVEQGVEKRVYHTDYTNYGYSEYANYMMLCSCMMNENIAKLSLWMQVYIIGASGDSSDIAEWRFSIENPETPEGVKATYWNTNGFLEGTASFDGDGWNHAVSDLVAKLNNWLADNGFSQPNMAFTESGVKHWFNDILRQQSGVVKTGSFNRYYGDTLFSGPDTAANAGLDETPSAGSRRWYQPDFQTGDAYIPAYCAKNFMFVDENLVTLNSPEISYEAINLDNVKLDFRVIGVAKMSSVISDYEVSATQGDYTGENLFQWDFSKEGSTARLAGLTAWPLWIEHGLTPKTPEQGSSYVFPENPKNRKASDYSGYASNIVYYWFYLWGRTNSITGYNKENENKSILNKKIIGNLHCSYKTIYTTMPLYAPKYTDITYRMPEKYSRQMRIVKVGSDSFYYNGGPELSLSCPGSLKYPIRYSIDRPDVSKLPDSEDAYLFSTEPIQLSYLTDRHLVFSLGVTFNDNVCSYNVIPGIHAPISPAASNKIIPWMKSVERVNVFDYNFNTGSNINQEEFIQDSVVTEGGITRLTAHSYRTHTGRSESSWHKMISQTGVSNVAAYFGKGETFYGYVKVYTDDTMTTANEYLVDLSNVTTVNNHYILSDADVLYSGPYTDSPAVDDERIAVNYVYVSSHYTSHSDVWVMENKGQYMLNPASHQLFDGSVEITYRVNRYPINGINGVLDGEQYVVIGEVFQDYSNVSPSEDTRYGGITDADAQACRFIAAGPQYSISSFGDEDETIYANQGDTYFQRWDCLMTVPGVSDSKNGVIDITSLMLETHLNLDGRTDVQRGIKQIASIDTSTFGQLNNVYSQKNNFKISRDLDDDFNTDAYRSSLTWTLQKADLADVDEWTHITLANSLKLDGDKGILHALRRYRNNIIAFQDRGISEILFNSRTQLSTQNGVPVEIANSGKVDGKRYITNKYGCLNKWSIVEGKNALYFIDNINKAFCALGEGIDNLSQKLGFSTEFKRVNAMIPWAPESSDNFISFYDRVHSDVYILGRENQSADNFDCLVYNEILGEFTSFFDYNDIQMMTNIEDRFVSFSRHKLWFQNEGFYGDFFGTQKPFYVIYRVTPNPYTDKVWTNIDYRADFYRVLSNTGVYTEAEGNFTSDLLGTGIYQPNETFDKLRVYNEYQDTGDFREVAEKKFRIWRYAIPRAKKANSGSWHTKYGLDRIRNPWVNIRLEKTQTGSEKQDLMQLHDVTVKYFE